MSVYSSESQRGHSALMMASTAEMVELLLSLGANPNFQAKVSDHLHFFFIIYHDTIGVTCNRYSYIFSA